MTTVPYTRTKGKKRTYDVTYDSRTYEIRFQGDWRKTGTVPVLLQGPPQPPEQEAELGLTWAKRDIEELVGMDE